MAVVEAVKAHSSDGHRTLEDLAVLDAYTDSVTAWRGYVDRHREDPAREIYPCHTSRETVEIEERTWLGVRSA